MFESDFLFGLGVVTFVCMEFKQNGRNVMSRQRGTSFTLKYGGFYERCLQMMNIEQAS